MAGNVPQVAPHHSCIVCWKGDTTTALAFIGSREWQATGLARLGVPVDQAIATVTAGRESDPESAAYPENVAPFVVCADCADKAGLRVAPLNRGQVPAYREPEED